MCNNRLVTVKGSSCSKCDEVLSPSLFAAAAPLFPKQGRKDSSHPSLSSEGNKNQFKRTQIFLIIKKKGEIYLIYNGTAQSLVLRGYFISSQCFSSEATEPFDLIRLIRWGWVATWLGTLPCGDYSIRCYKAEQKMYLLLLRLRANHRIYLRYCLAGGSVGIRLAFKAWAKTWIKHAETESEMLDGMNPKSCENVNEKAKRWRQHVDLLSIFVCLVTFFWR